MLKEISPVDLQNSTTLYDQIKLFLDIILDFSWSGLQILKHRIFKQLGIAPLGTW